MILKEANQITDDLINCGEILINCGEIKVQELYRIVIPRAVRSKYHINPGDSVEVFLKITGEVKTKCL